MEQYVLVSPDYQLLFQGIVFYSTCRAHLGVKTMKILHLDSSILGAQSASRRLTAEIVTQLKATHPEAEVQYVDLTTAALPHLSGVSLAQADQAEAALNAQALADFLAADVIVIGAPMYNFSVPTQLKSWIDRVVVAGKTFRYTENGPVGLVAAGKKAIIASSTGGIYTGESPARFVEHNETYLKAVLTHIGIEDVEVVRAEGIGYGPEARARAIESARGEIGKFKVLQAAA